MPGSRPRIYWDANCFIAYTQGEATWLPVLRALLEDANIHGSIEIVTSVLSVTEVAFGAMERVSRVLNPEEEARLDRFWSNSAGIKIIEYNERVARYAREIRREDLARGWKGYRTPDIIHLATARYINAVEIQTTDSKLHRYSSVLGIPVRYPFTSKVRLPGM